MIAHSLYIKQYVVMCKSLYYPNPTAPFQKRNPAQTKQEWKMRGEVRAKLREKRGVTEFSSPRHLPDFGGQNTKKKNVLSILEKNHPRENTKKQGTFFLFGVAE